MSKRTNIIPKAKNRFCKEAMIKIPLSSLRFISRYPQDKKVVCEIDFDNLKRVNASKTLDEIISESKLDYALGDYKTENRIRLTSPLTPLHS
jgi:hypothetical protein